MTVRRAPHWFGVEVSVTFPKGSIDEWPGAGYMPWTSARFHRFSTWEDGLRWLEGHASAAAESMLRARDVHVRRIYELPPDASSGVSISKGSTHRRKYARSKDPLLRCLRHLSDEHVRRIVRYETAALRRETVG